MSHPPPQRDPHAASRMQPRLTTHGIDLSPFLSRFSPRVLAVPLTLIRTETHHDNFAEARLKGSIFSRPKKIECRRRQPFKLACGVSCQRRTNGAAHPPPLHLRACCSHKSCANRMYAFCGSRLSTTLSRTTTPRSWEAPYVHSESHSRPHTQYHTHFLPNPPLPQPSLTLWPALCCGAGWLSAKSSSSCSLP